MPKTIVFCADGTWNGPENATGSSMLDSDDMQGELEKSSSTNVLKLYASLAGVPTPDTVRLADEQEKNLFKEGTLKQVAKYLHGVGDSENPIMKLMGGIFGAGIIARIVRGYTFVSRNYQPGDAIIILGFSRGAYTARALAGMISRVGLLNPVTNNLLDKEAAYRLGLSAWSKSHSIALTNSRHGLNALFSHLVNYVENWLGHFLKADALIPNVPIKAVAVWDTVGAMGIPEYKADQRIDLFRFVDNKLSSKVEYGFHAMAVDEMRADFPVTRWEPRDKITERWFVGAHADVGGGYLRAESGLSDIALNWLGEQVRPLGVSYLAPPVYDFAFDWRRDIHTPWSKAPFDKLLQNPRSVKGSDAVDDSVLDRLKALPAYRPESLKAWLAANPL